MTVRILIAEDEDILRRNLCDLLRHHGYEVTGVADGVLALEALAENDFDVLITDLRMPRMDGISLLRCMVAEHRNTHVLVTTAYASVDTAIEALRMGAFDYLIKPIVFEDLLQKLKHLDELDAMHSELRRLRRDLQSELGFEGLIGKSKALGDVFRLIEKVAPTKSTVLITGESGTGKELVARAIGARAEPSRQAFLALNMAAIAPEMFESQLFGHEKGSFTGANRSRSGCLRSARGGTVFLDEIGELPLAGQAKLLRALETGEVLPVGADRPEHADFRLVAATNQDLSAAVEAGTFRSDLFFRLNVFRIQLPALRERRDDIPLLVAHFVNKHARAIGQPAAGVNGAAMRLLLQYAWPGNVRELSNVIERASILACGREITSEELPAEVREGDSQPMALKPAVEHFEARHIAWVLQLAAGNKNRAAELLGVDPATLYRKLAKYEPG